MKYKIAAIVFGVSSLGLFGYESYKSSIFDWWACLPILFLDCLSILLLWKMATAVWLTDNEFRELMTMEYIVNRSIAERTGIPLEDIEGMRLQEKIEKLNALIEIQRKEKEAKEGKR